MASSINASTTAGVVTTADTSGVLNIQTAGTTAISISAAQAVSFTNPITGALNGTIGATTPATGAFTTVQIGTNPAGVSIGVLGIPNQKRIYGRNAANNADVNILYVDGSNGLVLGPSDAAVINSSGDMGLGTTNPPNTAGYTTLALNNATNGGFLGLLTGGVQKGALFNAGNNVYIDCNNAAGNLLIRNTSTGATSTFLPSGLLQIPAAYTVTTGAAANLFIDASGGFYRSTSSLKYKTDVENATHGLAEVMQLRAVTYKGTGEFDGETVFGGLIAEEVHEVGLIEFVQYAEDGTPDALNYGNMVSLCIKAIQEQQALITQLQADVAALKGA